MKEIVILSGKGGTGKTSLTASFANLANNTILVDCDVDAADLFIITDPKKEKQTEFYSGKLAYINPNLHCINCGECSKLCEFNAISKDSNNNYIVNPLGCEGCGVCVRFCPVSAIKFSKRLCGEWFISQTRFGKMVHAKLGIGAENSGKLIATVREQARKIAKETNTILIDGPPGIGCPVIASITGVDAVVIVTEPTVSGIHDLKRVSQLAKHFGVKQFICINKYDLNLENCEKINTFAKTNNIEILGNISYDINVTKAQIEKKTVIEYNKGKVVNDIKGIWSNLCKQMNI